MAIAVEELPVVSAKRRWQRGRWCLLVVTAIAAATLGAEAWRVMFGSNLHVVVPGRIYRCSQPSAAMLDSLTAEQGIRTVINLRGPGESTKWYLEETRSTHQHGICQEDISFSAGRLPSVAEVRRLIEVLERTPYPVVLHCRRGADRTGLAVGIAVLLTTDAPLEEGFSHLAWRFGHVALGRPAQLDQFFTFYREWLTAAGKTHSREKFRDWALHHYIPGSCWAELDLVKPLPPFAAAHEPTALHVRARNASLLPWVLGPQWTAGVHLGCHIYNAEDLLIDVVKSGLRDGQIAPGESADFTVAVPPLRKPGRYRLQIDMVDEQQCWFYQTGSQPLEVELIVRE